MTLKQLSTKKNEKGIVFVYLFSIEEIDPTRIAVIASISKSYGNESQEQINVSVFGAQWREPGAIFKFDSNGEPIDKQVKEQILKRSASLRRIIFVGVFSESYDEYWQ